MKEMMPWTSFRLTQRAAGRGPLAWWAMARLVRAGDRGETRVTDDLWDLWRRLPRGDVWAALSRWRRPHSDGGLSLVALGLPAPPADVVEAANRTGHPVAATALARILAGQQDLVDAACEHAALRGGPLTAFCLEHELAPADPHRAAVFFLATGQYEKYLVSDPDHSLLAVVYQGAGEYERSVIRACAGDHPELVRVLADTVGRGRMARLSDEEAGYLAGRFAERKDWPGLWELVRNLPLLDAATAVRRFDGWRPDGPDATLFDALAAADLPELTTSHAALGTPWRVAEPETVTGGSVAPDGRRIVVTSSSWTDVFAFEPGAGPEQRLRWITSQNTKALALGGELVLSTNWDRHDAGVDGFSASGYEQLDGAGPRTSWPCKFYGAAAFALTSDGFATLTYAENRSPRLHLLSGSGPDFAGYGRRDFDLRAELGIPVKFANGTWSMAVHQESGLIAFAGDGLYLARITEDGLDLLASAPFDAGLHPYVAFDGPGALVGLEDRNVLKRWQRDGDELTMVAERKLTSGTVAVLPAAGVIAAIESLFNGRRLCYLDSETLDVLPVPHRIGQQDDPTNVFASPDGTRLVVGHYGYLELLDVSLAALGDRPLAATTPADLHRLRTRIDDEWTKPAAKPFLELLHTCLVHRFEVDVAIGRAAPLRARGDDIALGESP